MATRSTIALEYADGTIGQVYCHWDGYLENNGKILFEHYVDPFKLRDLIDLGDVSSLGDVVGEAHPFSRLDILIPEDEYESLYGHMTTFYGRDRGESGTMQKTFIDFQDYEENFQHEEFAYILRKDGNWYVKAYTGPFEMLKDALSKCNVEESVA
jgi:hypothetical protein